MFSVSSQSTVNKWSIRLTMINMTSVKLPMRVGANADPGLWDLCVVAAMDKFTRTVEILWRKRDSTATL